MTGVKLPRWIVQRGRIYYYKRHVPERLKHLAEAPVVRISLNTDDLATAVIARDKVNAATEQLWAALLAGEAGNPVERYNAAVEIARSEGFSYQPAKLLRDASIEELRERILRLEQLFPTSTVATPPPMSPAEKAAGDALLGLQKPPELQLAALFDEYEQLTVVERRNKSPGQLHKWRLPHHRAIRNILGVVGDKPLAGLTRSDALAFQRWWTDRITEENLKPESANKEITLLSKMLGVVSDKLDLDFVRVFRGLRFKADKVTRPPFSPKFVREKLLAPGALDGLNMDARAVVWVMIETGARPIEIVHLAPDDIRLDHAVPHIAIRPRKGYALKTKFSEREIPIVGIAIEGARHLQAGVSRYHDNTGSLSAAVNKFLGENKLLETEDHSLYSLRHSFRDRLTDVSAPDIIDKTLMGHKPIGENYGKGPTLERKLEWIRKIAVSLPPQE